MHKCRCGYIFNETNPCCPACGIPKESDHTGAIVGAAAGYIIGGDIGDAIIGGVIGSLLFDD